MDGVGRRAEFSRDRLRTDAGLVHLEGPALTRRERGDVAKRPGDLFALLDQLCRVIQRRGAEDCGVRNRVSTAGGAPALVDREVTHDPEEPRAGAGRRFVGRGQAEQAQVRLLHDILGSVGPVAKHAAGVHDQVGMVRPGLGRSSEPVLTPLWPAAQSVSFGLPTDTTLQPSEYLRPWLTPL